MGEPSDKELTRTLYEKQLPELVQDNVRLAHTKTGLASLIVGRIETGEHEGDERLLLAKAARMFLEDASLHLARAYAFARQAGMSAVRFRNVRQDVDELNGLLDQYEKEATSD